MLKAQRSMREIVSESDRLARGRSVLILAVMLGTKMSIHFVWASSPGVELKAGQLSMLRVLL